MASASTSLASKQASDKLSCRRTWMTTASGTREIPLPRQSVWQALTVLAPYCPVCDVSYIFSDGTDEEGSATMGKGTRFVCVAGRLDGAPPPQGAVKGEVVEWVPQRRIETRLELTSERWHTRIELADAEEGSTGVTVTVTHEPGRGSRLLRAVRRRSMQRTVQRTVHSELAKLPDHMQQVAEDRSPSLPKERRLSSIEHEAAGRVLHLRGEVDAAVVQQLELQRQLEELAVVAIDVRELTYIDSTAFAPLLRWAQRASRAGRRAVVRGANQDFDDTLGVMGMTAVFVRER
ncbi:STAS domain-containing protein [Blastococcus sp. LR1]|uniref:STAS domain-containing protein n=1 Tax=Blastococcus sp. LR1 TaxID=2877000 RepID=UPI001CCB6610|nr:STAS domain-containing protein [Blastococcus sp. LR1]MCA0143818.1 STAS domain-containing protein [Blastococcus sp. LR1]